MKRANIHQREANSFRRYLCCSEKRVCIVSGRSGSGKTFLISNELMRSKNEVIHIKFDQFLPSNTLASELLSKIHLILAKMEKDCFIESDTPRQSSFNSRQDTNLLCQSQISKLGSEVKSNLVLFIDDYQWSSDNDVLSIDQTFPSVIPSNIKLVFAMRDDEIFYHKKIALEQRLIDASNELVDIHIDPLSVASTKSYFDFLTFNSATEDRQISSVHLEEIIASTDGNLYYLKLFLELRGSGTSEFEVLPSNSNKMHAYFLHKLGRELCYISFVCAQIGFSVPIYLLQEYFSMSPQLILKRMNLLVEKKLLAYNEKNKLFSFTHDFFYELSINSFNRENLQEVNQRLFMVIEKNEKCDEIENKFIKRASFFICTSDDFQKSYSFPLKVELLMGALSEAIDTQSIDVGFKITKVFYKDLFKSYKYLDENIEKGASLMSILAFQKGEIEFAEKILKHSIDKASFSSMKASLMGILAELYYAQNDLMQSTKWIAKAIELSGVSLSKKSGLNSYIQLYIELTKLRYLFKSPENLKSLLVEVEDDNIKLQNSLLIKASTYFYSADMLKSAKSVAIVVDNSLKYGVTQETSLAIQLFSTGMIGGYFRNYEEALYLAEWAFHLSTRNYNKRYHRRAMFANQIFLGVYQESIDSNVREIHNSFYANIEIGSPDIAAWASHVASFHRIDSRTVLADVKYWINSYEHLLDPYKQSSTLLWNRVILQFTEDLSNLRAYKSEHFMAGEIFSIDGSLNHHDDESLCFIAYNYRAVLNLLFGYWQQARSDFSIASKYRDAVVGTYMACLFEFYRGVVFARLDLSKPKALRLKGKLMIKKSLEFISAPIKMGGTVLIGKNLILEGYQHLLVGDSEKAIQKFVKAEKVSLENDHLIDRLIAIEALLYLRIDEERNLSKYLEDIKHWGADSLYEAVEKNRKRIS